MQYFTKGLKVNFLNLLSDILFKIVFLHFCLKDYLTTRLASSVTFAHLKSASLTSVNGCPDCYPVAKGLVSEQHP